MIKPKTLQIGDTIAIVLSLIHIYEEKQEILLAMQSLSIAQNNDEIIRKLSAIFNLNTDNGLEIDFSRWGTPHSENKKFEQLKSAVIHQKCVKIAYASSYEEITERIIQPLVPESIWPLFSNGSTE